MGSTVRLPPRAHFTDAQKDLELKYLSSQRPGEYHPASPLVDFIMELSQNNSSARQAVLDSGFLDLLLCMYISDFKIYDASPKSGQDVPKVKLLSALSQAAAQTVSDASRESMLEVCSDHLATLCRYPDALAVIKAHPICVLWPRVGLLRSEFGDRTNERPKKWWELGPALAARRLASFPELLLPHESRKNSHATMLPDICTDLLAFVRWVSF
jgi:hypothetical protein